MNRNYEGVIVLNTQSLGDGVDAMISRIGKEMEEEGAKLQQIDQLGRREFAYPQRDASGAFYVNYRFEADPSAVEKVRSRLSLIDSIRVQHYQVL